jgi:peptide/nickel transport system substrate-binding protein
MSMVRVVGAGMLGLMVACAKPAGESPTENEAPEVAAATFDKGDDLVMVVPFDPGNINPLVAPYQLSGMLSELVNPGLAIRDVDESGLIYRPGIAKSWTWSEDGLSLEYTLRDDLMWSGGDMVRAADVVFTHDWIADPATGSNWFTDSKGIESVKAVDVYKVRFQFKEARNKLLQQGYTFRGLLSEHGYAKVDREGLRGDPIGRMPPASGSWVVSTWLPNERLIFRANPQAPESLRPYLNQLVVRVLPEYSTRLLELEQGKADLLPFVEIADVERLEALPNLRIERVESSSMQYIGYNLRRELFKDPDVRRALTVGLDREDLIKELLTVGDRSFGRPSVGTISPALKDWVASDLQPRAYDPEKAKGLLEKAGWVDSNGDGLREREGKPLTFTLIVQTGSDELKKIAVRTQAMWKDLGVTAEIEMIEPLQFTRRARSEDFDALLWSFGANPKVDPTIKWHTDGAYNWFGYSNPKVDAAIEAGVSATDVAVSQEKFKEVQRMIYADDPAIFLYWKDDLTAIDRRFENVSMNLFSVVNRLHEWHVPLDKQKAQTTTR